MTFSPRFSNYSSVKGEFLIVHSRLRFQLDDDLHEAVKDELIYAKKLAMDEGNRGLAWTGNVAGTTEAPAPSPQSIPAPLIQDTPSVQHESPLGTSRIPEAERRQLTVMFCDLVDSTQLSGQLDPEEYRDMVRAYQRVCSEVITRFDGHIAQLLGDGLLVYFGYPHAHEDDAQRAVRTGFGILDAMGDLNTRLQEKGIQLALRMGIHTGLVVVGEMGSQGRQEHLALGEVPNVASRLQGLAEPNTIFISTDTYRLIQGYFECQALGVQALRGVTEPIAVYRVLRESGAQGRLDIAQPRGLTPLVGREQEVGLLLERWEQAKCGQGQVVLLTGDAGIGKSRLVQMLKEHVANEPHTRWECRSLSYFENTALFPLTDLFQRLLRFHAEDTPDEKVRKLEHALSQYRLPLAESGQLFAPLLSLRIPENHYPPLNLSPQRQRQKTLETIVAILLDFAAHQPMLFIVEDLHWTDPTTLELLNLVLDQTPTASMLVLLTCRPHFQPSWHHRSYLTEITVNRLSHTQGEQIVTGMTNGKTFPAAVLQQIIAKTDGVPLFVEELTKMVLESGLLREDEHYYELIGPLPSLAIPATLHDSLMARLDRLATVKDVAQLGATIGRTFAFELLQAVSSLDEATLQHRLRQLVEAELVYQRGMPPQAIYTFKHALIQDAAYQSLLRSTRQQYHQHIAQALKAQFPEIVATQPELLARHYTEANRNEQAVGYWQQAGEKAIQRSAYVEAIGHFTKGLEMLQLLPNTLERSHTELALQLDLGPALRAAKGQAAPEMRHVYTRARELCQQVGDVSQLFAAMRGLWGFHLTCGEFQESQALAEQLLHLAQRLGDSWRLLRAHYTLGTSLFYRGELVSALAHYEQGMALYATQERRSPATLEGQDAGISCLVYAALTLCLLGYLDQARRRSHEALSLAQELDHPFSIAFALNHTARVHQHCREVKETHAIAERLITLASERGLAQWMATGKLLRGWVLAEQGQGEAGIAQMDQGMAAYRATGSQLGLPHYLALLAEAYTKVGYTEVAGRALAEALLVVHRTGGRHYEAELYWLKVELLRWQSRENAGANLSLRRKRLRPGCVKLLTWLANRGRS
jgi:class 3 adenylate cyclase/predicted ATPase